MQNGVPDRVPCAPDISNYIPCKRSGLPFWEIYFEGMLPLWKAYSDAASHYGFDMWIAASAGISFVYGNRKVDIVKQHTYDAERDAMLESTTYTTPDGNLEEQQLCYRHEPPMHIARIIKDPEQDWRKYRWMLSPPTAIDTIELQQIRSECEEKGQAFGCTMGYPGFHAWEGSITGGISTLSYLQFDNPQFLERWCDLEFESGTVALELFLAEKPDYILFGGSGTLTLSSPDLVMRYAVPALKKWTGMARDAGVATMLHSCGKSRLLVDMLVEHTDLDCINPLEVPPMGDTDLAEVKAAHGKNIALMGNLHTIDLLLYGSAEDVYRASAKAMEDAKAGGGFILSTGDQCPIDTPDENLFAMMQAVEDFGWYR